MLILVNWSMNSSLYMCLCFLIEMIGPCLREWSWLAATSQFWVLWGISMLVFTNVSSPITIIKQRLSLISQLNLKLRSLVSETLSVCFWKDFHDHSLNFLHCVTMKYWCGTFSPRPSSQFPPLYELLWGLKMDTGWLSVQLLILFLQPTCPGFYRWVCLESLGSISLLIMEATLSGEFYSSLPACLGSSLQSAW